MPTDKEEKVKEQFQTYLVSAAPSGGGGDISIDLGKSRPDTSQRIRAEDHDAATKEYVRVNRLASSMALGRDPRQKGQTAPMVTHEELNAKLELIEERMDRRVENIERLVKTAITEEKATREAVKELKKDNKSTKATIRNTGITVVVAVLSLVSLVTLLSNSWIQRSVTSIEASSTRIEQKVQENTESILKLTQKK